MRGIKTSELYDKAMRGDEKDVPIGAPFMTNKPSQLNESIRLRITQDHVETIGASQVYADGREGLEIGRNVTTNSLTFSKPVDQSARRIVEMSFDDNTGILTLTRANKEQFEISNFLRTDQLGQGAPGRRGADGRNGHNARSGKDGRKGATGCPGEEGKDGQEGPSGDIGRQGAMGITGPDGCDGVQGQPGVTGRLGAHGYEGPRGVKGPSCKKDGSDSRGAAGATGATFGEGVWIGTPATAPLAVAIVGLADDGIDSPVGKPGTGVTAVPKPPTSVPTPPPPPPPKPTDPPKPPDPPPIIGDGVAILCTRKFGSGKEVCGGNNAYWTVICVFNPHVKVHEAYGISNLCGANNTAWWTHTMALCGGFTPGARFRAEFTVPAGIIGVFAVDCGVKANIDNVGGTKSFEFVAGKNTSYTAKLIGKTKKIPVWFALRVFDMSGKLVYYTGQNQDRYSETPDKNRRPDLWHTQYKRDNNWFGNSIMQTIGDF